MDINWKLIDHLVDNDSFVEYNTGMNTDIG